jgi:hypothetical protein
MNTSSIIIVIAFTAMSFARVGTAGDLLDAPGPGYFQQIKQLSPRRTPITFLRAVSTVYIVRTPSTVFPESLSDTTEAFSRSVQLILQSPTVIKSGQEGRRVIPPAEKPQ